MKHESYGDNNCNWCPWYSHQKIGKMTRRLEKNRTSRDNSNSSLAEIGQNTKKNTGNLRRLVVTETPLKDHQLKRM